MATFPISTAEQNVLEQIKNDGISISANGVSIDTDGNLVGDNPYIVDLPMPVKNWNTLVPAGSTLEKKVSDGLRVAALPVIRQTMPIGWHDEHIGLGHSITGSNFTLNKFSIPQSQILQAARQVMVTVSWSAFSTVASTTVQYWIDVNGTATTAFPYVFNEANSHRSMSGNWLVTIPPGTVSITFFAVRTSGTGVITMDSGDFSALTLVG